MPATSASVERLFSVVGQVVTAKRNSLHPSSVTLLVFLHEAIPGVIEREALAIIQDCLVPRSQPPERRPAALAAHPRGPGG